MNLLEELNRLEAIHGELTRNTTVRIVATDGVVVEGGYCCYINAGDNDPEVASIDIWATSPFSGYCGIPENEIASISILT